MNVQTTAQRTEMMTELAVQESNWHLAHSVYKKIQGSLSRPLRGHSGESAVW